MRKTAVFLVSAILLSAPAQAATITKDMLVQNDAAMTNVLNHRQNPTALIHYMHDHISENAKFTMSVSNPTLSQMKAAQDFQMDKAGYINSFIQGPAFIKNYRVGIRTTDFAYDPATGQAHSTDIITERGMVISPRPDADRSKGQDMYSETTCHTTYALQKAQLVITGGTCRTNVSLEEAI